MTTPRTCDLLACIQPPVATLEFRPPGHARHEGTFIYQVCAGHRDTLAPQHGYTEIEWRDGRYQPVDR